MSNSYVQKECQKIIGKEANAKQYALASAFIIANFKGINLKIFDMKNSSSLCDYNIIASVENNIQARAIVEELIYCLKQAGLEMLSLEGNQESDWILLDLGEIIIHLFQEISRDIYDLDSLWHELDQVDIPQEYYFGAKSDDDDNSNINDAENYF